MSDATAKLINGATSVLSRLVSKQPTMTPAAPATMPPAIAEMTIAVGRADALLNDTPA
jgi:hypothetical protein